MIDAHLADTLVRLASIGTSGISVLAIFWIGILIRKTQQDTSVEWHKTVRFYMATCVTCALIAGASGVANAMFNLDRVEQVEQKRRAVDAELAKTTKELDVAIDATKTLVNSRQWSQMELTGIDSESVRSAVTELENLSLRDPGTLRVEDLERPLEPRQ